MVNATTAQNRLPSCLIFHLLLITRKCHHIRTRMWIVMFRLAVFAALTYNIQHTQRTHTPHKSVYDQNPIPLLLLLLCVWIFGNMQRGVCSTRASAYFSNIFLYMTVSRTIDSQSNISTIRAITSTIWNSTHHTHTTHRYTHYSIHKPIWVLVDWLCWLCFYFFIYNRVYSVCSNISRFRKLHNWALFFNFFSFLYIYLSLSMAAVVCYFFFSSFFEHYLFV